MGKKLADGLERSDGIRDEIEISDAALPLSPTDHIFTGVGAYAI